MAQFTPSVTQMKEICRVANLAYDRISKTVEFDPHLDKLDAVDLGSFVARVQGALLDLVAETNRRTAPAIGATVETDNDEETVFKYLDDLRESGVTNMFGATPFIEGKFEIGRADAGALLTKWMRTFEDRHPK